MRYCIFSGTFNPIHNGHIGMAKKVIEEFKFDEILFIPAYIQPHKNLAYCKRSAPHRLEMLKLALEKYPNFKLNTIEFDRKGLSYTYITILELYKRLPNIEGKINFVIGTDAFLNIYKWQDGQNLVKLLDFIVLIRDEKELEMCKELKGVKYRVLQSDKINISSTMVREMVKSKQDITELVPPEVKEYIDKNRLYRD
ncbi:MAG: nicotinate (nicotinamide) nucleotide adenylyltransferase [bacterium]|nr:nicotinate (nicotinamide) nucleotide adenylyltransferase [bacterium]